MTLDPSDAQRRRDFPCSNPNCCPQPENLDQIRINPELEVIALKGQMAQASDLVADLKKQSGRYTAHYRRQLDAILLLLRYE